MKRILIVDDSKVFLEAISLFVSCQLPDCAVLKAANGAQAIETMDTMPVDLILTDLNMPVVSGYQLIEYVKKNLPSAPVLGMTAVCTPDVEERLRRLGVSSCIEKPFDLYEVAHRISAALEKPTQPSLA